MKIEWKTCLKIGVSIFLLYLCIHYWDAATALLGLFLQAATPLLVGCVIAYLLNILMSFYERHYFPKSKKSFLIKSRRPVCLLLACVTLVCLVVLIVSLVLPQFISCIALLLEKLSDAGKKLLTLLEGQSSFIEDALERLNQVDWKSKLSQIIKVITSGVGDVLDLVLSTVTSVVGGLTTAFISVIFSVYLLLGKEKIASQCKRLMRRHLKPLQIEKINHVLHTLNESFHQYIVGQCTEAVILGLLCTLGMLILRLPYATMIGALISFTALIPVAGAFIGGGVGAFMILTEDPIQAVIFLVFLILLQQLEGNIIYPRVVGSSIGLPGIWVLAAVTVGGGVLGILGMLLGVPLVATIYRLLRESVNHDEALDGQDRPAEPQSLAKS